MLFMIIEHFNEGKLELVGERFKTQGRMLPEGVEYITSWMELNGNRCFQVMESPTREALDPWINSWSDLVDFEVIPIQTSQQFWSTTKT